MEEREKAAVSLPRICCPRCGQTLPEEDKVAQLLRTGDTGAQILQLCRSRDIEWTDAQHQHGPKPSDFGEHEAIPEEAVVAEPVTSDSAGMSWLEENNFPKES